MPYRRKKLTFAISSSDEFLFIAATTFESCDVITNDFTMTEACFTRANCEEELYSGEFANFRPNKLLSVNEFYMLLYCEQ